MCRSSFLLASALLVSALAVNARAQGDDAAAPSFDEKVRRLLELGVEESAPASAWRELGIDSVEVLVAIARDSEELPIYRQRAVFALASFQEGRILGFLQEFATFEVYGPDLRAAAMAALASSHPEEALATLAAASTSEDSYLRRLAGITLGNMPLEGAAKLLASARERESVPHLIAELDKNIARQSILQASLRTSALLVEVTRQDLSLLPVGTNRWVVTVSMPAVSVPAVSGPAMSGSSAAALQLVARVTAPEGILFDLGTTWSHSLQGAEPWTFEVQTHSEVEELDGSFQLFLREENSPLSERRVDVRER